MRVAIIGAGLSGSSIYNALKKDDHSVVVFEKSRGVGGRCSTRYIEDKKIDHGTPFFKAQSLEFSAFCDELVKKDLLVKKSDTYYPRDGINKICSVKDDDLLSNTKIVKALRKDGKWTLTDSDGKIYDGFDRLVITIPAPQVLELDLKLEKHTKESLMGVEYEPIAAVIMYSFDSNTLDLEDKKIMGLKKAVDNSKKYGYKDFSSYLFYFESEAVKKHNISSKEDIKNILYKELEDHFGKNIHKDFVIQPHFWKYALVSKNIDAEFIYEQKSGLGFCGDYFGKNELESAFISLKRLYENKFR
jgi:predicted NAD/FAD-dependent oxidoreductase